MLSNDYDTFVLTLNGVCEAVSKPLMSKAGVDVYYMSLAAFDLPQVQQAMLDAVPLCANGFDFNVNLVLGQLKKASAANDKQQRYLANQQKFAAQIESRVKHEEYKKTEEYIDNAAKGAKVFADLSKVFAGI